MALRTNSETMEGKVRLGSVEGKSRKRFFPSDLQTDQFSSMLVSNSNCGFYPVW